MLVSSPEAGRVRSLSGVARKLMLALAALLTVLSIAPAAQAAAASKKAPKLLSKSKIVAPSTSKVLTGTLSGKKKCAVKFPAANKSVSITVTGPLSAKKPKTKKLKVKKGSRTSTCTWATKSYLDGKYRFAIKAKVKASGRYWNVSIKRALTVKNKQPVAGLNPKAMANAGDGPGLGVGNTRYVGRLESSWDNWINTSGLVESGWMRQHMWGAVAHTGFFDSKLIWAPPTIVYKDLYAVYANDSATLAAHPDWVLKDAAGNRMAIPWGCANGSCPQFAGDIGNPAFRAEWIAQARLELAKGYKGLWIDDANMEMRISDQFGVEKAPIDPRTGATMTFASWRKYIAEFLEQIRRELPQAQLVANVLWFGGTSIGRDADQFIQRAYTAVDRLNLERGFNDDGLTGGATARDIWSVEAFMSFIDRMHDRGIPVTLDSIAGDRGKPAWEYNLAGYYLVDRGEDAIGELSLPPGEWWSGWDLRLGGPKADRLRRSDGVYTREFQSGSVFLNPPRGAAKKITLPKPMKRIDGSVVTSVTLASPGAAVLLPV
ncbi:MAG: putative glycoside hydrolase [Solirubrobacteraceae bacterium]|nr:putative glycoside hydrolase [Solirubrobacteraceae bacterium]